MENNAPEYQNNYSWIWWSLGAILATAVITVTLVGLLTGQWPWNRGEVQYNGRPTHPTETTVSTESTIPEDTTVPGETEEQKKPSTQETQAATTPGTEPTQSGTGSEETPAGGNGQESGTGTTQPTQPGGNDPVQTQPTTSPTEPEETEPEQTEPTTKPTEPEEEDTGGGVKPEIGDIDVPINPKN